MATSKIPVKIQLIYHNMRGRADSHIRMLEEAGLPYDFAVAVPGPHAGKFMAFGGNKRKNFAPPYLIDGDVVLTQTLAITAYIGEKCGFTKGIDPDLALQYMLDINDFVDGFFKAYSEPAQLAKFMSGRGATFMMMFNEQIVGPFYFGAHFTYVDFLLCAYIDMLQVVVFNLAKKDITAPFNKIAASVAGIRALKSYQKHTALPLMKDSFLKNAEFAAAYVAAKAMNTDKPPAKKSRAAKKSPAVKPILTYFDGPMRAEAIRLIFKAGGLEFTDKRIKVADWPAMKKNPDAPTSKLFCQMPIIEHGDFLLGQSMACQSYAADLALPDTRATAKARAIDGMFQNVHADIFEKLLGCVHPTVSADAKAAALKTVNADCAPLFEAIERLLPGSGYIKGGATPSAADLVLFDLGTSVFPSLKRIDVDVTPYPKFNALVKTVGEFGPVKSYCAERHF